jgi:hypothetical protein
MNIELYILACVLTFYVDANILRSAVLPVNTKTTDQNFVPRTTDNSENSLKKDHQVREVKNTFICPTDNCQRITSFSLSDKYMANCHDKYLPVSFNMQDASNKFVTTDGFLPQGAYHLISSSQVSDSSVCQRVKR